MKKRNKRGICRRCGKYCPTEWHHVFGGCFRKISEREGFVMELCHDCHMELHDSPGIGRVYKERLQREWEGKPGRNRNGWMSLMGKSWLVD